MKKKQHVISGVVPGSIAEEMEIEPGDLLLQINDMEIEDILDYQFYAEDEELTLLIRKADGEEWELEIEKEYGEDIGLVFENGLMDDYRSCSNKCIFCFIDQMPPDMRETLYFKDDDARLSFLQGNYITLTNLKDKDMERIVRYHLSPINISVHTTNPELRCQMLHNRFAGRSLEKIDYFYEHEIEMNGQIVLCKGYNDGEELKKTLQDLTRYCPVMQSVSVVPVGLTKYREGLCPLEPFTAQDAAQTIDLIEEVQKQCMERFGIHFVHASDEFYILAGRELPQEENYDGYPQLENGVGMLRLLLTEAEDAVSELEGDDRTDHLTIATGRLALPYIQKCVDRIHDRFPGITVDVAAIQNRFFGELITVSGLITGQDLLEQLTGRNLGSRVLIPINMLRSGEEVFLDDMTVSQIQNALQVPVVSVKSSGYDLVGAITGIGDLCRESERCRPYEPEGRTVNEPEMAEN
ncbi:MAG: DUF512 domain-containing protein [Lachnospiraceae bacterium]|nr:DUF512 domain-containing protein [Lachnospiraceae bacterium]MDY4971905.1 DUF512 domain-containing protein [Lachnospiraceae bacterium]